ncbi:hypothetical protein LguiA_000982 [Lonicera macranthoides]
MCHNDTETDLHALVSCPLVRRIWNASNCGDNGGSSSSFIEWWNQRKRYNSVRQLEITAVTLWRIWMNRNSQVWHGKSDPPVRVAQMAEELYVQWKAANSSFAGMFDYCANNSVDGVLKNGALLTESLTLLVREE